MDLRMKYKDDEILEAILKNLSENHLIYTALKTIGPTAPTILTDLGKEFLQFISEQDIKNKRPYGINRYPPVNWGC